MNAKIRQVPLDKLIPHPDNANRMSRAALAKLARNIERTGCYEPLVVRAHPDRRGYFQIINGRHRCHALRQLGRRTADAVVWNVDDRQTDVLLMTLNRLGGRDVLSRKLDLLRRLRLRRSTRDLARLLPQTQGQLERLTASKPLPATATREADEFAIPMVFFVNKAQQQTIEQVLAQVDVSPEASTRAARRAGALSILADRFLNRARAEVPE